MSKSTTQLSLARMRSDGFTCAKTEHWNPFAKRRFDLFNFCDILCIHEEKGIIAVQTTVYKSMLERMKKISKLTEATTFLAAGGKIEIHGWQKVGGRWVCKVWNYPECLIERK